MALFVGLVSPASAAVHLVRAGESIQHVLDGSAAGDTVVIEPGVYFETVRIGRPVTLRARVPGTVTITNRHAEKLSWRRATGEPRVWFARNVDWPVHWLWVEGVHAFDYRSAENFRQRVCGPFWSKAWQEKRERYAVPPLSFARDAATHTLWLRLDDDRDPNTCEIHFNSARFVGSTLVQKDLGAAWNQQRIVMLGPGLGHALAEWPVVMWYGGSPDAPAEPRRIDYPPVCGVLVEIEADDVTLEGLRLHVGPTVIVDVNDSHRVTIRDCLFSGYQFGLNTGYRCTRLTVEHCEFDGGLVWSRGGHRDINAHMWYHSTYVIPVKFNGTGLVFRHNYVHEGYDLFHPRGRHKDFSDVPDLCSEVAFNVWQNAIDNALEFDGVEARMSLRFHHNLVLSNHDALAITTTENGGPLTIDHNLWWPGGGRIMKLVGTGRTNRGVRFLHNTYFTGPNPSHNFFEDSAFENNLVLSGATKPGDWTPATLGDFFPTRHNLLRDGQRYTTGFAGLTADPRLGDTPATRFTLQAGSLAINAGRVDPTYYQANVTDGRPDLGAMEYGETIDTWRAAFGRCGPTWITPELVADSSVIRPPWPAALDRRWGGLEADVSH